MCYAVYVCMHAITVYSIMCVCVCVCFGPFPASHGVRW